MASEGLSCQGCALVVLACAASAWGAARVGWVPAWVGTAVLVGVGIGAVVVSIVGLIGMVGLARENQ